jgi:hypothetical protein
MAHDRSPCSWRDSQAAVPRAHCTSVSAMPGASATSFSRVAVPGGTDTSTRWKRAAAKIAHTTHDGGMFDAGQHESHVDTALRQLLAHGLREPDERELRGTVAAERRVPAAAPERGDVHDHAVPSRCHDAQRFLHDEELAEEVHAQHRVEVARSDLLEAARDEDTGVVDDQVEPPEAPAYSIDAAGDLVAPGDVRRQHHDVASHLRRDLVEQRLAPRGHGDMSAGVREGQRRGTPDAARRAGDEDDGISKRLEPGHATSSGPG